MNLFTKFKARWGRLVRSTEQSTSAQMRDARARSSCGSAFVLAAIFVPAAVFVPVLGLCLLCRFCVRSPALQKAIFF